MASGNVPQLQENMVKIVLHGFEKTSFTSKVIRHLRKALFRVLVKMCENCIAILQPSQSAGVNTKKKVGVSISSKRQGTQQFLQILLLKYRKLYH